jgi:hypothetical protein
MSAVTAMQNQFLFEENSLAAVSEALAGLGHERDFDPVGTLMSKKDFLPTSAPPGSPEEIAILRARLEQGQPLWHEDDRNDFAGITMSSTFTAREEEYLRSLSASPENIPSTAMSAVKDDQEGGVKTLAAAPAKLTTMHRRTRPASSTNFSRQQEVKERAVERNARESRDGELCIAPAQVATENFGRALTASNESDQQRASIRLNTEPCESRPQIGREPSSHQRSLEGFANQSTSPPPPAIAEPKVMAPIPALDSTPSCAPPVVSVTKPTREQAKVLELLASLKLAVASKLIIPEELRRFREQHKELLRMIAPEELCG